MRLATKSYPAVNLRTGAKTRLRPFQFAGASAAQANPAKPRRGDQITASHVRTQSFGDIAGKRSDGIVAHELGEKGQFAPLISRL